MIKTHHTFEWFGSPSLLHHRTLSLAKWKAKSIAPHVKQQEAKWAVSMAFYSIIAQLPGRVYSALLVLLFTALLVFVDKIE